MVKALFVFFYYCIFFSSLKMCQGNWECYSLSFKIYIFYLHIFCYSFNSAHILFSITFLFIKQKKNLHIINLFFLISIYTKYNIFVKYQSSFVSSSSRMIVVFYLINYITNFLFHSIIISFLVAHIYLTTSCVLICFLIVMSVNSNYVRRLKINNNM